MNTKIWMKAAGSVLFVAAAIAAADPTYSRANEVEIKRGGKDIRRPTAYLFATPAKQASEKTPCGGCKNETATVTTQDTKLKTKTLVVQNHQCTSCKTTFGQVGPKSNPTTAVNHTCLAIASGKCCN